jgi:3-dehydroquinate dehydratase-2
VQVLVLNGVNLDMLGHRDPEMYGSLTIGELETQVYAWARELDVSARCQHTNHEGDYIDALIVNPGAWSHYSYAIRDALDILEVPIVEVHLSNIDEREEWRRRSVIADLAAHRVVGKGPEGYREALVYLAERRGVNA